MDKRSVCSCVEFSTVLVVIFRVQKEKKISLQKTFFWEVILQAFLQKNFDESCETYHDYQSTDQFLLL